MVLVSRRVGGMSIQAPICKVCGTRHWGWDAHGFDRKVVKVGGITASQRLRVLARNGGRCVLCNSRKAVEVDHIVPRGMGGRKGIEKVLNDADTNLRGLCKACHQHRHG